MMAGHGNPKVLHPPGFHAAELIARVVPRLRAIGVPAAVFEPASYQRAGYTGDSFAARLRPFDNTPDEVALEKLVLLGYNDGYFEAIRGIQAGAFYRFLQFLKTDDGIAAVDQMMQRQRLAQPDGGGGVLTTVDIGWLAMFDAMRNDEADELNDARRATDMAIEEADRALHAARARQTEELAAVAKKYSLIGEYVPLTDDQLNRASWNMHRWGVQGVQPPQYPAKSYVTGHIWRVITDSYSERVRQRHLLEFIYAGDHMEKISAYINGKIGHSEGEAERYRGLLASVRMEDDAEAAAGVKSDAVVDPSFHNEDLGLSRLFASC